MMTRKSLRNSRGASPIRFDVQRFDDYALGGLPVQLLGGVAVRGRGGGDVRGDVGGGHPGRGVPAVQRHLGEAAERTGVLASAGGHRCQAPSSVSRSESTCTALIFIVR